MKEEGRKVGGREGNKEGRKEGRKDLVSIYGVLFIRIYITPVS